MEFIQITSNETVPETFNLNSIADFLVTHLEQYGDKKEDIENCIAYALDEKRGGFIQLGIIENQIAGVVIINKTHMDGYIPSNILVYIAVDKQFRGKGIGKQLIKQVIQDTAGGIALHVEPDNPAKFLYEKLGFTNKYLEMRFVHPS